MPSKSNINNKVIEGVREQLNRKKADPYYQIKIDKARDIQIDTIRALRANDALSGDSG